MIKKSYTHLKFNLIYYVIHRIILNNIIILCILHTMTQETKDNLIVEWNERKEEIINFKTTTRYMTFVLCGLPDRVFYLCTYDRKTKKVKVEYTDFEFY